MAKPIRLIWTNGPLVVIELCELLEEDDLQDLYYFAPDGETIIASVEEIMQQGMVMFQDDGGIFSLYADQIVNISPLG